MFSFDLWRTKGNGGYVSFISNICVTTIGVDGNLRGFRHADHTDGALGEISPNASFDGEAIFEFTWDVVTGNWILSFDDGTLELPNVTSILVKHPSIPDANMALWNATSTAYLFTDLTLAQTIDEDETKSCFNVQFRPYEGLLNSFFGVLRGTKV